MSLPKSGRPSDLVLSELERLREGDVAWRRGRAFSLTYFAGDEVLELAKNAYARFSSENALNTEAFPSLRRIQSDVVGMVAGLVHGGDSAAGFMTTGGTESLLLAVLAARERGRKERGIAAPEMVLHASAYGTVE
jgi:glutamate/tyrosine decarboxylase-like PLP-dependent enzyme